MRLTAPPKNEEARTWRSGLPVVERMTGFEPATSTLARWRSSQLSYIREIGLRVRPSVRDTGIEPVTSSVSGKRATAAPIALVVREVETGFEPV